MENEHADFKKEKVLNFCNMVKGYSIYKDTKRMEEIYKDADEHVKIIEENKSLKRVKEMGCLTTKEYDIKMKDKKMNIKIRYNRMLKDNRFIPFEFILRHSYAGSGGNSSSDFVEITSVLNIIEEGVHINKDNNSDNKLQGFMNHLLHKCDNTWEHITKLGFGARILDNDDFSKLYHISDCWIGDRYRHNEYYLITRKDLTDLLNRYEMYSNKSWFVKLRRILK